VTCAVALPHGLIAGVDYWPDGELAARSERSRNVRQFQIDD
jgi:hypothetical protein